MQKINILFSVLLFANATTYSMSSCPNLNGPAVVSSVVCAATATSAASIVLESIKRGHLGPDDASATFLFAVVASLCGIYAKNECKKLNTQ